LPFSQWIPDVRIPLHSGTRAMQENRGPANI